MKRTIPRQAPPKAVATPLETYYKMVRGLKSDGAMFVKAMGYISRLPVHEQVRYLFAYKTEVLGEQNPVITMKEAEAFFSGKRLDKAADALYQQLKSDGMFD